MFAVVGAVDPMRNLELVKRGFARRAAAGLPELERAIALLEANEPGAAEPIREMAHRLHGSAGSFGFRALSGAAADVEDRIDQGAAPAGVAASARVMAAELRRLEAASA